jgi:hypothetical protein
MPGAGYQFSNWSGAATGSTNPVSVTMDGNNKVVTAHTVPTSVLIAPSGALTSWGNTFSWTGLSGSTYYLLEVYDVGSDTRILREWFSAGTACTGLNCTASPGSLASLSNGSYRWRIQQYGSTTGPWSDYAYFTLSVPCYTLTTNVSPAGTGVIKNSTATNCTTGGGTGGYRPGTVVKLTAAPNIGYLFGNWSGDAAGSSNPIWITMDGNKSVTANIPVVVLGAPSGALSSWGNTFSWTGVSGSTYYLLEVYNVGSDTRILREWYSVGTACTGMSCTASPASLASLSTGSYKWRIQQYGPTTGPWTDFMGFSLP